MVPSFQDFVNSFSQEKLDYDLRRFGGEKLNELKNPFAVEQYRFLMKSAVAISLALMTQYHEWLAEELKKGDRE